MVFQSYVEQSILAPSQGKLTTEAECTPARRVVGVWVKISSGRYAWLLNDR